MPYDLVDGDGIRCRVPASITPSQLHVGGSPRVRLLRGYGSETWYRTLDGLREPEAFALVGLLHTDRDEPGIQSILDGFAAAVASAVALVQVDHAGVDVQTLPLLGSLPVTVAPDGIDGSLLTVTAALVPAGEWEEGGSSG